MSGLSRRHLLIGGLTLAAVTACSRQPTLSDAAEPIQPIDERIGALERRHNAVVGLYAVDIGTGRTLAHRDGDPFSVCSTFKAYAAARVLQKSAAGELSLGDPVYIDPAAVVSYSPVTGPKAGGSLTLTQLCEAALQRSDNTAGNYLLRSIGGPPGFTAFARSIGDGRTRLDRWETELNAATPGDPRDTSTPQALGIGYRNLLTGNVLGPPQRNQLENWMRGNLTSTRSMRDGLPTGWTTADKTGAGAYGSTNDIGVAYGPAGRRILLSVMTRSQSGNPKADNLQPLIAEVTKLALRWVINPD
ncbi:MAG: beta-lactamase class [Mycobacterium sp.]|nr:beta-lactamase class [Mycobacterium sp.]